MTSTPWIPLHVHSQYSVLEATVSIEDLVAKAKELHIPALALTDQGNMFGAIEFYKECKQAGIKPILGCALHLAPYSRHDKKKTPGVPAGFPLTLLAKNKVGYSNLCKLSSLAYTEGFYYTPRIDKEILEKYHEGLICLSGPLQGLLAYLIIQGKEEQLIKEARWFQALFQDDFYFELQRHPMSEEEIIADGMDKEGWLLQNYRDYIRNQEVVIARLVDIGKALNIKCVATQGSHYLVRSDWKAHEILMNIQSGEPCEIWEKDSFGNPKSRVLNPKREVYFSHSLYFKSPEEMAQLFKDIPEALSSSLEIGEKISFTLDFKTRYYPLFTPPDGSSKEEYLKKLCHEGIAKRYSPERLSKVKEKYPDQDPLQVIQDRLSYELGIIISKEMCDYLLIVHDFIAWAKAKGIPMGPGRGSGAGSIILFLIGITDIEPLRFNLFFERFINPERISYPDIDVDICMERRSEVIDYTVQKYGKDKVAQIITFGTMKAKMAIKDVGRVLSVPLAKVNSIAKLVPEELSITLDKALAIDADLKQAYETDKETKEVIDIARKLEGSVRNTGIHAAGIIISGDPLTEHIPICAAKESDILVTQYSMKPVEAVGMLKIDFLGLKTLTSIQKTVDAIFLATGEKIDWVNLNLEDERTFELLNHGKMFGIFQMESAGMQDLTRQLQVDKFEMIIAINALYRPGPMEMIPSFISRKHGKERIEIDHPWMKDVLDETYGIMVYQEQVMQIASILAGYSLGEGDVLRRAMGKKDREEMAKQREKFLKGALAKGIDAPTSMLIFDKVEKFASYGFNKSHAAAYGYLAYVTAYLKANYPGPWMAALLTCDKDDITKVAKIIAECQAMNIPILPPDVNESGQEFVATSRGIRFAMGGIKGVGEGVVDIILQKRNKKGPFKSLFDFFERIEVKKIGKKTVETLIEAGCFDFTGWSKPALVLSVEPMYEAALKKQKEQEKGIFDLFTTLQDNAEAPFQEPPVEAPPASKQQILKREKELLGFYLTGHPLDDFKKMMQACSCVGLDTIITTTQATAFKTAFILEEIDVKISHKNQKKFAILKVSDGKERVEFPIWSEMYEEKIALLTEGQPLLALLQVDIKDGSPRIQCKYLADLTLADQTVTQLLDKAFDEAKSYLKNAEAKNKWVNKEKKTMHQQLILKLNADLVKMSHILQIKSLFRAHSGNTPIYLEFWRESSKIGSIHIQESWGISIKKELEEELKKISSFMSGSLSQE